jgi:hypothetical protein
MRVQGHRVLRPTLEPGQGKRWCLCNRGMQMPSTYHVDTAVQDRQTADGSESMTPNAGRSRAAAQVTWSGIRGWCEGHTQTHDKASLGPGGTKGDAARWTTGADGARPFGCSVSVRVKAARWEARRDCVGD